LADERGTTRDRIEARLSDDTGPRCLLVDVAGLEEVTAVQPQDAIAKDATARARDAITRADVVISCRDAMALDARNEMRPEAIAVITRCDLATTALPGDAIATSSRTGTGIPSLKCAILEAVGRLAHRGSPATLRLAVGCQAALASLAEATHAVQAAVAGNFVDESLVASHLRRAADSLADVTGATVDTDLLDRIFARHCIGK
jgi:tRNA modification GTPase